MPISGGFYDPSAHFALPRSYIRGVGVNVTATVTQDGHSFHFFDGGVPTRMYTVTFDDRFWDWSSNRWTLDYMLVGSYYQDLPDPTHHDITFTLRYTTRQDNHSPYVEWFPFGIDFHAPHWYELPGAPGDYWASPFPP